MKIRVTLTLFVALLLTSCAKSEPPKCQPTSVGRILEVREVPTSFNYARRVEIRTDTVYVQVHKAWIEVVPYNVEAQMVTCSDGTVWISWAGASRAVPIIQ